jgi:hypothetical protein
MRKTKGGSMPKPNFNSQSHQSTSPPRQPSWAIADLVYSTVGHTKQARRDLIARLGYTNKGKAASRFDATIRTGEVNPHIRQRLPKALRIAPDTVNAAIEKTKLQQAQFAQELAAHQEAIDREHFTPQIVVKINIHDRRVPLVVCIWFGGQAALLIDVPSDLPTQAEKVQLAMARSLIEEYPSTEKGIKCSKFFGSPTHYIYCPTFDDAWELSLSLDLVQKTTGSIVPDGGSIRVANKLISNGHITPTKPV